MPAADARRAADAVQQLSAGRHLLLLLDFDGTLCEFHPDPGAVWLPDRRRDLLLALHARPSATLGIVSGRRLDDVRKRTRLPETAFYAGLHGLEIEGGGGRFVHPHVEVTQELVRQIAARLSRDVIGFNGVFIEDKGLSLVVHYRDADSKVGERMPELVEAQARPHLDAGSLKMMRGACMVELLPNIQWNKGSAVEWIRDRATAVHPDLSVVYVGDDVTDEDAFRVVRGHGLAIAASGRPRGADLAVDGPPDVEELLRAILAGR